MVFVLFGSYRWAERIFLLMSLAFFAYPVAMILGHPHWGEVGKHLIVPHMEPSKDFILLAVALIGTTVSPYMQFYAAAGVVDRGAKPEDYRLIKLDAVLGVVFACIISLTIIIATAAVIGGTGPLNSAAQAAEALRPVAGQNADFFALGLIGASALAGAVVPLSASYAIGEAAGAERSVSRSFRDAPLFLGLFTAQIVLGAVVAMTPVDVIQLLIGTQVLQGLISPIVLVYLLVLTNRRSRLVVRPTARATASPRPPSSSVSRACPPSCCANRPGLVRPRLTPTQRKAPQSNAASWPTPQPSANCEMRQVFTPATVNLPPDLKVKR